MNTCKVAWLVLRANIFQLLVYLLATVVMAALLGIGIGDNAGSDDQTNTYDPPTTTLAIIDRDSAGAHATGTALRSYLSATADIVEVTDDTQAIQDAIATQYVNLIVIVPQGYVDSFTRAAHDGGTLPSLGLAGASGSESTDSASPQLTMASPRTHPSGSNRLPAPRRRFRRAHAYAHRHSPSCSTR